MKDIYVKFSKPLNGKDIKGESRDAGTGEAHPAPWFEATSWQHFIRQPKSSTASTAGGHTAERCEHGEMIFTKDLDLWVDAEEAPRVLAAIRRFFGGDDLGLTVEDLASPGVVQLGYAPNRIDLVILETPPFDEAFVRALKHEVEGVQVYVVHPEDFKALKRAFGRPVDLRDLEELE